MPRLFPSFTRSREHVRNDYPVYDDYDHYEQPQRSHTPAWRKVIPNLKGGDHRTPRNQPWEEEFVEYPESYGGSEYHYGHLPRRYPAAYDYDVQSESTISPPDDHYMSRYDNNIPIVQRESSLSRLAEAFASQGASSRPVTEVSLPQGTPRYSPRDVSSAPYAPEIRNTYPEQHQPVMVPSMTAHSVQADIIGSNSRRGRHHRGRQEERGTRVRDDYRRDGSSDGSLEYMDDDDYDTYYIAVRHGRRGEKDKYWIVPSGTSVVFEDSEGNVLTRVGDNRGRYRPLEQPMILQDSRGREIGRLGFDDEGSLDYDYRRYGSSVGSDDDLYERDRDYDRGYRTRHNDKGSIRSDRSPRSEGSVVSSSDFADVYYIAPSETDFVTGRGSSHHSGRSSRSHRSNVRTKTTIIDLDEIARKRKKSGSISSGTSSGRSYDSTRRH